MTALLQPSRPTLEGNRGQPHDELAEKLAHAEIKLSPQDAKLMDEVVAAVHDAAATSAYQEAALANAPAIARLAPQRVESLFAGFDFHLTSDGPKLIEINANAGGAFYGALIDDRRWQAGDAQAWPLARWSHIFVRHLRHEWSLTGRGPLRVVAIVDDAPDEQFLRLELRLAARMLREAGITALIADPRALTYRDGRLWHGPTAIDLVYNRLTSFALDRDADRPLREALMDGAVVVAPDPRNHALLGCKQNLTRLSDDAFLRAAGTSVHTRDALRRSVPRTVALTPDNTHSLWAGRAAFYFKPAAGFGSRAVYDGAKLTAKTWARIVLDGTYVAQARIEPPRVDVDGAAMRFDVRTFAHGRKPFMRLARVYRGQTTNFRTPGGGFAPVRVAT